MVRSFMIFGVVLAAMTGSALAADLPSRVMAPPLPLPPIWSWTGVYVGINGGYGGDRINNYGYDTGTGALFQNSSASSGFLAVARSATIGNSRRRTSSSGSKPIFRRVRSRQNTALRSLPVAPPPDWTPEPRSIGSGRCAAASATALARFCLISPAVSPMAKRRASLTEPRFRRRCSGRIFDHERPDGLDAWRRSRICDHA